MYLTGHKLMVTLENSIQYISETTSRIIFRPVPGRQNFYSAFSCWQLRRIQVPQPLFTADCLCLSRCWLTGDKQGKPGNPHSAADYLCLFFADVSRATSGANPENLFAADGFDFPSLVVSGKTNSGKSEQKSRRRLLLIFLRWRLTGGKKRKP